MGTTDTWQREPPVAQRYPQRGSDTSAQVIEVATPAGKKSAELPDARLPDTERIRALAHHSQAESIVFQSVAVGALQLLDRVIKSERQLATAAISLAQREKLNQMMHSLETVADALRDALSRQGKQMLTLSHRPPANGRQDESWWFSLTDTMHVLEEGAEWIATVVAGQPKGSAARLLSSIVARLLHSHYNKLLTEAGQWME